MKELAFNTRTALNFPFVCSSLLAADVDNDGITEIVAGGRDGQLSIFKPDDPSPYRTMTKLGLITAMAAGDLFNRKQTVLVVISADGGCHVLRVSAAHGELQLCLAQPLQSNIKGAQIVDVDGDNCHELVVVLTDRVVRTYRYLPNKDNILAGRLVALNKWESPALITGFSSSTPIPSAPTDGIRIVLSQTVDKFVLLQPNLSAENEMAGDSNAVDRSVRYCEADPQSSTQERSRDVIFLSKRADCVKFFHMPSGHLVLVDDGVETDVHLPRPVFDVTPVVVAAVRNGQCARRMFFCCDCRGDVHTFDAENLRNARQLETDEDMLTLKIGANVTCFAAAYGKTELHQCVAKCFVVVSMSTAQLYLFTLPWSKIERCLNNHNK